MTGYSLDAQFAAHETRRGHGRPTPQPKELVDEARAIPFVPMVPPNDDLAGFVSAGCPDSRFSDAVLPKELEWRLNRVAGERKRKASCAC